ncbi:hypothetical protein ABK040_005983 [Willaertia magna]
MINLPNEMIGLIFSFLNYRELIPNICFVCKEWKEIILNETFPIQIYPKIFPSIYYNAYFNSLQNINLFIKYLCNLSLENSLINNLYINGEVEDIHYTFQSFCKSSFSLQKKTQSTEFDNNYPIIVMLEKDYSIIKNITILPLLNKIGNSLQKIEISNAIIQDTFFDLLSITCPSLNFLILKNLKLDTTIDYNLKNNLQPFNNCKELYLYFPFFSNFKDFFKEKYLIKNNLFPNLEKFITTSNQTFNQTGSIIWNVPTVLFLDNLDFPNLQHVELRFDFSEFILFKEILKNNLNIKWNKFSFYLINNYLNDDILNLLESLNIVLIQLFKLGINLKHLRMMFDESTNNIILNNLKKKNLFNFQNEINLETFITNGSFLFYTNIDNLFSFFNNLKFISIPLPVKDFIYEKVINKIYNFKYLKELNISLCGRNNYFYDVFWQDLFNYLQKSSSLEKLTLVNCGKFSYFDILLKIDNLLANKLIINLVNMDNFTTKKMFNDFKQKLQNIELNYTIASDNILDLYKDGVITKLSNKTRDNLYQKINDKIIERVNLSKIIKDSFVVCPSCCLIILNKDYYKHFAEFHSANDFHIKSIKQFSSDYNNYIMVCKMCDKDVSRKDYEKHCETCRLEHGSRYKVMIKK